MLTNMPQLQLVITADDFGIGHERDDGIIDCYKAHVVTRASLLVNGVSVKEAVEKAKKEDMPIGLHMNLTEGNPLANRNDISSLIAPTGYFWGMYGLRHILAEGKIDMKQVRTEMSAQIEAFQRLTGSLPGYVDGHQHIHVLPGFRDIFASVLGSYGIQWTRLPRESFDKITPVVNQQWAHLFKDVVQQSLESKPVYKDHNIRFTDTFVGMVTMSRDMSIPRIIQIVSEGFDLDKSQTPNDDIIKSCELMVHPGYPCLSDNGGCGDGPDDFTKSDDRSYEISILKSPEIRNFYEENQITLVPYPALAS